MKLKFLLAGVWSLCTLLSVTASANVIYTFQQTYASGGQFTGELKFGDDGRWISGTGTLSGGTNGYDYAFGGPFNCPRAWQNFGCPGEDPDTGLDWLLDWTESYGILIYWDYSNPGNLQWVTDAELRSGVYSQPDELHDPAVRTSFTFSRTVPEPSSLALLGFGLAGLARAARFRPRSAQESLPCSA